MSDGFSIGAAMQAPTIFECPHCHETIDSTADACRFCGTPIDHEQARKAAEVLAKVNQACSDASYMRTAALALPVFFVLRFLPFFSWAGLVGFVGLSFAIPIWAFRWWYRFDGIETTDREFSRARRTVLAAGIAVTAVLFVFVILPFLAGIVIGMARR